MSADKANDKRGIGGILVKVFVDLFDCAFLGVWGLGVGDVCGYAAASFCVALGFGSGFRPRVKVVASPWSAGGSTARREVVTRALVGCCGRSRVWAGDGLRARRRGAKSCRAERAGRGGLAPPGRTQQIWARTQARPGEHRQRGGRRTGGRGGGRRGGEEAG